MAKRFLSLMLTGLLVGALCTARASAAAKPIDISRVEKVKEKIAKRAAGKKSRVTVKMQDGTKVKGYVSQAGENDFVLTDPKSGQKTTIAYSDVAEVKGQGMSRAAKIGIGVGAGVAVVAVVGIIAVKSIDPFERGIF